MYLVVEAVTEDAFVKKLYFSRERIVLKVEGGAYSRTRCLRSTEVVLKIE
jgi:hypothetical protein